MCVCVYRAQQNNGSVCALYILSQRGTKRIDIAQHELALWRACHGWKLSYDRNFTILGEMNKYLFCWMVDVREWESEREKATRLNGSGRAMSFEQKEIFTNAFEFNLLSILMAILSDGFKFGWAITQLHTSAHWSADASTKSRRKKNCEENVPISQWNASIVSFKSIFVAQALAVHLQPQIYISRLSSGCIIHSLSIHESFCVPYILFNFVLDIENYSRINTEFNATLALH